VVADDVEVMPRRRALAVVVLIALLVGTLLVAWSARRSQVARARSDAHAQTERTAATLRNALASTLASLQDVGALFGSSQSVTRAEFAAYAHGLLGREGLTAVTFVSNVPPGSRRAFERQRGFPIVEPDPQPGRVVRRPRTAYAVTYVVRNTTSGPAPLGLDINADPSRAAALAAARDSGVARATAPIRFLRTPGTGIIIYQPIYTHGPAPTTVAERRRRLLGFASGAYRVEGLSGAVLDQTPTGGRLRIEEAGRPVAAVGHVSGGTAASFSLAGQRWSVAAAVPSGSSLLPAVLLGGGLVLTLLVGALFVVLMRRERYALTLVEERLTERQRAEEELRAQRDYAEALVGALQDGVAVFGADGRIVEVNERLCEMLGFADTELIGHPRPLPHWPPEEVQRIEQALRGVRRRGGGELYPTYQRKSGQRFPALVSVSPLRERSGGERSHLATIKDISALKRAETQETALRRVATAVAREAAPEEIFELVARLAAELLGGDAARVARFVEDDRAQLMGVWRRPELPAVTPGSWIAITEGGVLSRVKADGRPARVERRRSDSASLLPASVGAPIHVAGELWGAVAVAARRPEQLPPDAEANLARFADLVALAVASADARQQLATLAATDHLTGLSNRRAFEERLEAEVERAERHGMPLALVVLDLDHFKRVNDTHGHEVGDRVLREVARRLGTLRRAGDDQARLGGEEFAWILPGSDADGALIVAERARRLIGEDPFPGVGPLTISAGVCALVEAVDGGELFRLADAALYEAKRLGRDRSCRHDPSGAPALQR
jgi:diguanylate cyclase (GGDEF)-like protein/PAS domain S-box-containing protein